MPISLTEMESLWADPVMLSLVRMSIAKKAVAIINEGNASEERLQKAKDYMRNPESLTGDAWHAIVAGAALAGVSNPEDVTRSLGDNAVPTDAWVDAQVAALADALWPPTP